MSMNMNLLQVSETELARFARDGVDEDVLMGDADAVLDLHKSWHVLHYVFTGKQADGPMPAATLLRGGREVGDDLGYGPARALSPAETKAFAQFLDGQTAAGLAARVDVNAMEQLGIYSADDESADDVDHYFPQLKAYVGDAAQRGHGLVIWMI
jgi:hypothetical protein